MNTGTYQNPILYADYSDPDAIRVGEDYYMVASSFTYLPGVPLLHSRDLVHWEIINYCVPALPFEKYDRPAHGSGTWAPSIRYHKGEFFVFIPLPDEGIFVARSKDPRGTFQLNRLCESRGWIDPCPFWDEDGKAYMVFAYARSRCGIKHRLALAEIDPECTGLRGEPRVIFDGTQLAPTSEGPKMYKRNGWYYILMPSGGVATGWQSALRAKDIQGPYEYKIVMHQGNTAVNGPHQGAWVDTPEGTDWFIHFQDVGELGRIVHLQPMCFQEDWPFIGCERNGDMIGEPVEEWELPVKEAPVCRIADSDEFENGRPGLQWQWQANPKETYFAQKRGPKVLRLACLANGERENLLWYAPNVMTQIPQSAAFTAEVKLALAGDEDDGRTAAGDGDMAVLGMTGHHYAFGGLEREKGKVWLRLYEGFVTGKEFEGEAMEGLVFSKEWKEKSPLWLRMELSENKKFSFSASEDGENFCPVGPAFHLEKGTWTGAKLCLWACNRRNEPSGGWGEYDYIHISHKTER